MPRITNINQQPVSKKKELSGSEKGKRDKRRNEENKVLAASLDKHIVKKRKEVIEEPVAENLEFPPEADAPNLVRETESGPSSTTEQKTSSRMDCESTASTEQSEQTIALHEVNQAPVESEGGENPNPHIEMPVNADIQFDLNDPAAWPKLTPNLKREIILRGPTQVQMSKFPKVGSFSFHQFHYQKTCANGEIVERDWLVYSTSTNTLFCFPCCLFSPRTDEDAKLPWKSYGSIGFQDFHNQSRAIKMHEEGNAHFQSYVAWKQFKQREALNLSIDSQSARLFEEEVNFWRSVLHSIVDAVIYLAKNSLAFRGKSSDIKRHDCGNYVSLIDLLSKYHSPLNRHLQRLQKGKINYLTPQIQNEFISVIADSVRSSIVSDIKNRKYFSIMFDSTPDCSKKEQISQVIRTVNVTDEGSTIEESFIDFLNFEGKTGEEISQFIVSKLKKDGIEIANCLGQGYDNASNMSGKYRGVQARVLQISETAFFIPCAAHSLNLVGKHSFESSLDGKLLSGQIQMVFNFFSSSTQRWAGLMGRAKITPKSVASTRWSAKSSAVGALCAEYEHILDTLDEMTDPKTVNSNTLAEATSILNQISNFKFIVCLKIWNAILGQIDKVNQLLQSEASDLQRASKLIQGLVAWLEEKKLTLYDESWNDAVETATNLEIELESGFPARKTRGRKPARYRDKSNADSQSTLSHKEKLRLQFYDPIIEKLLDELKTRFESMVAVNSDFSFLWGTKLANLNTEESKKYAADLALKYANDLNASNFVKEIEFLRFALTPFSTRVEKLTAQDVLNLLAKNSLSSQFVNCQTALRIFLTLPVTVASNERSFSKLKIIKNYLRSSMGQERLSNLSILSIEHERLTTISFDKIINNFCALKCRRIPI